MLLLSTSIVNTVITYLSLNIMKSMLLNTGKHIGNPFKDSTTHFIHYFNVFSMNKQNIIYCQSFNCYTSQFS